MSDQADSGQDPPPHGAGAALVPLIGVLAGAQTVADVGGALVLSALSAVGATRGALLRPTEDGQLRLVVEHGAELPPVVKIPDLRARMWRVLLGQTHLAWDSAEDAPTPFRGREGWDTGLAMLVPSRVDDGHVLVVGGGHVAIEDQAVAMVRTLGDACGPILDTLAMRRAQVSTRALLDRVAELASTLATAGSPQDLLLALTEGLTALDGIDSAVVWAQGEDQGTPAVVQGLPHSEGASPTTHEGVIDDASMSRVTRLLKGQATRAIASMLADAAPLPDGRLLSLLPISDRPGRLLGLVHSRPLGLDEQRVLATLTGSLDLALRQAEISQERRSMLAMFGRVLRPVALPEGIEIAVEHHPNTTAADVFGGDFYDWFVPAPGRVVVALGDVAGKGIAAAAASSMAVWSLRALGRQGTSPAVAAHLMDLAVSDELGMDRFVTIALADVELDTWTVRLVLAGQPPPILLGATAPPEGLQPDRPLGVLPDGPAFMTRSLSLEPGQALVLYTDGAMDAVNASGVRLGPEALDHHAHAMHERGESPDAIAAELWRLVCDHGGGPPDDDCAIVVIGRPAG